MLTSWRGLNLFCLLGIPVPLLQIGYSLRFFCTSMKNSNTNKTILVIDSNKIHRLFIAKILNHTNYNLVFARNEKEIYYYCHSIMNVDLVLIELFLCGTDAFALIKLIKKIKKDIPIIVLTICSSKKDKEKCFKAGCDAYLSKPFSAINLIPIVEQTLKN